MLIQIHFCLQKPGFFKIKQQPKRSDTPINWELINIELNTEIQKNVRPGRLSSQRNSRKREKKRVKKTIVLPSYLRSLWLVVGYGHSLYLGFHVKLPPCWFSSPVQTKDSQRNHFEVPSFSMIRGVGIILFGDFV